MKLYYLWEFQKNILINNMFVEQINPMSGMPPIHHDLNISYYKNDITDDIIIFEYFDNKPFKEINTSIFRTVKDTSNRFFIIPKTFVILNKKKFERLLKICALQGIENEKISLVYYYIDCCESRRFKFEILEYISTL